MGGDEFYGGGGGRDRDRFHEGCIISPKEDFTRYDLPDRRMIDWTSNYFVSVDVYIILGGQRVSPTGRFNEQQSNNLFDERRSYIISYSLFAQQLNTYAHLPLFHIFYVVWALPSYYGSASYEEMFVARL
jgi:hypothetical protein